MCPTVDAHVSLLRWVGWVSAVGWGTKAQLRVVVIADGLNIHLDRTACTTREEGCCAHQPQPWSSPLPSGWGWGYLHLHLHLHLHLPLLLRSKGRSTPLLGRPPPTRLGGWPPALGIGAWVEKQS